MSSDYSEREVAFIISFGFVISFPMLVVQLYVVLVTNFLHNLVFHRSPPTPALVVRAFESTIRNEISHAEYILGPESEL